MICTSIAASKGGVVLRGGVSAVALRGEVTVVAVRGVVAVVAVRRNIPPLSIQNPCFVRAAAVVRGKIASSAEDPSSCAVVV